MIRRFDVLRNPSTRDARAVPYLLVLQSDLLDGIDTRVVAPLVRRSSIGAKYMDRLNPEFDIDGDSVIMLTQQIAALPLQLLTKRVSSLDHEHERIIAALDLLFSGI